MLLKSFPLLKIVAMSCNVFGKIVLGAMVGHCPLVCDTLSPDTSLDAPKPLSVTILVLDIEFGLYSIFCTQIFFFKVQQY